MINRNISFFLWKGTKCATDHIRAKKTGTTTPKHWRWNHELPKNPRIQSPVNPWPCNRQGSECAFTSPNLMSTGFWKVLNLCGKPPVYLCGTITYYWCSISKPTYYFSLPPTQLTFLHPREHKPICEGIWISASEFWSLVHKTEHPQWIKKTYFKIILFLSGKGVGTV